MSKPKFDQPEVSGNTYNGEPLQRRNSYEAALGVHDPRRYNKNRLQTWGTWEYEEGTRNLIFVPNPAPHAYKQMKFPSVGLHDAYRQQSRFVYTDTEQAVIEALDAECLKRIEKYRDAKPKDLVRVPSEIIMVKSKSGTARFYQSEKAMKEYYGEKGPNLNNYVVVRYKEIVNG